MSNKEKKKVFVGMSGGVDSSVAALLLKNEGYDVTGVFINGFNVDGCQDKDAEDARRAADHIGIPFYALDAREEYFEHVVQYMIEGYRRGLTPNPDVMCNKEIKFGIFLDKALKLGADYIATGHYVRLRRNDQFPISNFQTNSKIKNSPPKADPPQAEKIQSKLGNQNLKLQVARDLNKDQSYFLWTLTQEQLKHCLFPIGEYTKAEVREIARKAGLPNAEKKDSQGICFLGKVKLPDFLKEYIEPKRGDVLNTEGDKIGEHEGVQFYTIGQRHLGINLKFKIKNLKFPDRGKYYIVEKDMKTNTLVVAEGDNHPALFKREIALTDVHFISSDLLKIKNLKLKILCRVRYRQPLVKAALIFDKNQYQSASEKSVPIRVIFENPQKFIAPGQSAVFYSEDVDENGSHEMLGGGVILR